MDTRAPSMGSGIHPAQAMHAPENEGIQFRSFRRWGEYIAELKTVVAEQRCTKGEAGIIRQMESMHNDWTLERDGQTHYLASMEETNHRLREQIQDHMVAMVPLEQFSEVENRRRVLARTCRDLQRQLDAFIASDLEAIEEDAQDRLREWKDTVDGQAFEEIPSDMGD